jgi:tetratricopeptide (TPR) repeat protein
MTQPGKPFQEPEFTSSDPPRRDTNLHQLDFELEFYRGILRYCPDFVQALRVLGHLLTLTGRYGEGLQIDKRLSRLRPNDPDVHYSLACNYAKLNRADQSLQSLRRAMELGYRDITYIQQDHDLEAIRNDPRFQKLLGEFALG